MNELNTVGLPVFVQLANVIFEKSKEGVEKNMASSGMFKMESVPGNTGNIRQYTEIDLNRYASKKGEGDNAKKAKVLQGYSKNLQSYRVAADIGITYEMRTQNKYSDVINRLTSLATQAEERKELDMAHRLTFGTATTYTDMDGDTIDISTGDTYALFYTAHTIKSAATTYRNILANNPQLSRGALELMEKQVIENSVNQFGEKVKMTFDLLWTTDDPNTVNTALEYLRSVAAPDGTNSGIINVYKGKYKHVILPLVATDANGLVDSTKAKYWGLASTASSTAHVLTWEESRLKIPSEGSNGEEFSTDDMTFGVRAGYGIAIVAGQWIAMSKGDATA
jgi:hypothetical protein